jgi:hypothetical protein
MKQKRERLRLPRTRSNLVLVVAAKAPYYLLDTTLNIYPNFVPAPKNKAKIKAKQSYVKECSKILTKIPAQIYM